MEVSIDSVRGPELPLCPFVLPNAVEGVLCGRFDDDPISYVSCALADSVADCPGSTNGSTVYGITNGVSDVCVENAEFGALP